MLGKYLVKKARSTEDLINPKPQKTVRYNICKKVVEKIQRYFQDLKKLNLVNHF